MPAALLVRNAARLLICRRRALLYSSTPRRQPGKTDRTARRRTGRKKRMKTVRLTMAQALVRYLIAQKTVVDRRQVPLFAGRLRHLRPRQRHLPRRGPRAGAGCPAHLAGAERAVHGACRDRLHTGDEPPADHDRGEFDRAGLDQHGHRCRDGARQPAAGALPRRRHLRQPHPRSGAAAGRALRQPDHDGQRCLQGGHPLLGPHHPAGTDPLLAAPGGGDHARSRRLRPGLHRPCPGRPGRGLRLPGRLLRAGRPPDSAPPPRRRPGPRGRHPHPQGEEAADHRRRRRALLGRRSGARRLRRAPQPAGQRDHARQDDPPPRQSR